jgi:hypothetical protein
MSQLSAELENRPSNATYRARATVDPDGHAWFVPLEPDSKMPWFATVVIRWYDDHIKVSLPKQGPGAITQAFLTGKDDSIIIDISKVEVEED